MDWQHFLFNPEHDWLARFDLMARKRMSKIELADDAVNQIIKQFSDNNWSALGDINQQKSPGAYLTTLFRNRLEDLARQKFGRPRAPQWLKNLGGIWMTVYKRLCLERQTKQAIVFALDNEHNDIAAIITTIKSKHPKCGSSDCQEISLEGHQEQHQNFEPEQQDSSNAQEQLLLALAMSLGIDNNEALAQTELQQPLSDLNLSDEQQIILKLIYQQGLKISQVARMLNQPDHYLRKLHRNTLIQLKNGIAVRQGEI